MKQLYPKQQVAADFYMSLLKQGKSTLDTSAVGTGKTVVAAHIAQHLGAPVFVICPKSVITMWHRELAEFGVVPVGVTNYEKVRMGNTPFMSKRGKRIMTWHLPPDTIVLMDEVHNCKSPTTQNAQLFISLVQQGYRVHAMSATAAEDPTEMRALGYACGLHSLLRAENGLLAWPEWMMRHGCFRDSWNQWKMITKARLHLIHDVLYNGPDARAKRLTVEDFPDSFRLNRVFVEPIEFDDNRKIHNAYEELGITPQVVTDYIENGTVTDHDCGLVNLLRARQLAEAYKVPQLTNMAQELVEEGYSVVVFVNFRDTSQAIQLLTGAKAIEGGQSTTERQRAIDDFQADRTHLLIVNTAAGGTGVSLHDVNGVRPRVSLISPTFNAKQHLQTLGRIHRNGAQTDALQKIIVAAGTVEEVVMKAIARKTEHMEILLG